MKKRIITALLAALLVLLVTPAAGAAAGAALPETADHWVYHDYIKISVGEAIDLAPLMTAADSEDGLYPVGPRRWSSERPELASVTGDGVAAALQTGFAEIRVMYYNSRAESVAETVRLFITEGEAPVEAANLLEINIGKRVDLKELLFPGKTGGSFTWKVERSFLAEADEDGILEALIAGEGAVYGTYTDEDGNETKKAAALEVIPAHHGSRNRVKVTLAPGETINPGPALFPDEQLVTFDCRYNKDAVVTIGEDRRVTAKKPGDCVVTVTTSAYWTDEQLQGKIQIVVK